MSGTPFRRPNAGFITAGSTIYVPVFTDGVDRGAVFAQALPLDQFCQLHTDRQSIFKQFEDLTYSIRVTNDPGGSFTRYSIVGAILS